jgi:hypothetical protein
VDRPAAVVVVWRRFLADPESKTLAGFLMESWDGLKTRAGPVLLAGDRSLATRAGSSPGSPVPVAGNGGRVQGSVVYLYN